jgi:hypothetical protein
MSSDRKTEKETMRRVDEALKRAFQMPHKPHEPLKKRRKPRGLKPSKQK